MTRRAPTEALVVAALLSGPQTPAAIAAATRVRPGYVDLILRRLAARGDAVVTGRGERDTARGRYPLLWRLV